jgi:hypothetical protein
MIIKSITPKRTVELSIQTIGIDQSQVNRGRSGGTGIIVSIGVIVDDGMDVTEDSLSDASEIDLLRGFWHVVRPHDVFVGYGIAKDLAVLRQRTWKVGLIPSREIDLRTVYQHQMLDPASLRAMTGGTEDGSAEALLSLFGLPGKTRR